MIAYIEFSQQLIVSRIKPDIHLTHCKPLYSWRNSITPSRVGLMWMLSLAMVYLLSWVKHFPIILFMVEGEKKDDIYTGKTTFPFSVFWTENNAVLTKLHYGCSGCFIHYIQCAPCTQVQVQNCVFHILIKLFCALHFIPMHFLIFIYTRNL